jgi:hypothetical protein
MRRMGIPTFWAKVENEFVGVEAVDVREAVKDYLNSIVSEV